MIKDDTLTAYLDGELDAAGSEAVRVALTADPALQGRLEALSARDERVRLAFDALLDRPVPERLVAAARQAPAAPDNVVAFSAARRRLPKWTWVAAALAAQAAVLAGAAVLVRPSLTPPAAQPAYTALSAPAAPARVGNVLVIFAPDTAERTVRAALTAVEGRIIDGPTATGAWVVSIPQARRDQAVVALSQQPGVTLAQPVDPR